MGSLSLISGIAAALTSSCSKRGIPAPVRAEMWIYPPFDTLL